MKFAFALLVLLPLAFSATMNDKRFIETIFFGQPDLDIIDLAKQLLNMYGPNQTLAQCEDTFCPELVNGMYGDNTPIANLLCGLVCKEVQVLAMHDLATNLV